MCVGSQAIKCQKSTYKNESIITSTSHGKYFRFWLWLARADCRQPVSLSLVISAFSCIQRLGDNVNPHRQHNSKTTTVGVAISKYYALEWACSSLERLFFVSCQYQKWKCAWSSDRVESRGRWSVCHHPILFLCPVTQNHVALVGWVITK